MSGYSHLRQLSSTIETCIFLKNFILVSLHLLQMFVTDALNVLNKGTNKSVDVINSLPAHSPAFGGRVACYNAHIPPLRKISIL